MAYTKTNWVDNTTPVNAANMNNIENELVALDGRVAVPAVVNGQWLKGVGGVPVWSALAAADIPDISATYAKKVGYGMSLPASPADGDEYVLVDSVSNPAYQWRFRYNAGHSSDAFKWEFVGGPPVSATFTGAQGFGSAAWVLANPSLTVPRAGWYQVSFSGYFNNGGSNPALFGMSVSPNAGHQNAAEAHVTLPVGYEGTIARTCFYQQLVAGDVLYCDVYQQGTGGTVANRWLSLEPIRVS